MAACTVSLVPTGTVLLSITTDGLNGGRSQMLRPGNEGVFDGYVLNIQQIPLQWRR